MRGKHDPTPPQTYFAAHEINLHQCVDNGAIVKLDLHEDLVGSLLYIYGTIFLRGDLVLGVNKAFITLIGSSSEIPYLYRVNFKYSNILLLFF